MSFVTKITAAGILFGVSAVTGFILHSLGRPLHNVLFSIHKLAALGFVIFLSNYFYHVLKHYTAGGTIIFFVAATILSVVMLFITGALLSIEKTAHPAIVPIHTIAMAAAVVFFGGAIYFLYLNR